MHRCGVALVVVFLAVSGASSESLFVPVVAHSSGLGGTFFVTDVRLFNPGPDAVTVDLLFSDGSSRVEEFRVVGAGEVVCLPDVVLGTFARSGVGSLELRPSSGALIATSRTYNTASSGTYGQFIAARPASEASSGPLHLLHIAKSSAFRANVGFCETTGNQATVRARMYDDEGVQVGATEYALTAYGFRQLNDIFAELGVAAQENARVTLEVVAGQGRILGYASVVDNRSSDQSCIPTQPAPEADGPLFVAAGASATGAHGSVWKTDVRIANLATASRTVALSLLPNDQDNTAPPMGTYSLAPGALLGLNDVLQTAFGYAGNGALMIDTVPPGQAGLVATSRTYNESGEGTFGQFIPALPAAAAVGQGCATALQVDGGSAFRSNVGFLNASPASGIVTVELHSESGALLASRTYPLQPYSPSQINDIFTAFSVAPQENARVDFLPSGGAVIGYASVIDNASNDPVCVIAQPWRVSSAGLPDLSPATPAGWSAPIVVSTTTGTHTDGTPVGGQAAYVDIAIRNQGVGTSSSFSVQLTIDGSLNRTWTVGSLSPGDVWTQNDVVLSLAAGAHSLQLVADSASQVSESNEANNTHTRTLTWQSPGLPDLLPTTPSGWSGPIVVSTVTGTHTNGSPVGGQPAYIDVALKNTGGSTAGSFTVTLAADGSTVRTWNVASLAPNGTWTQQDVSITLGTGSHTLRLTADSANQVPESNETNNVATKTATWSGTLIIYHGNVDSKIFHKPGCRYYYCGACTAIFYSREAAIAAGYRPCMVCDP